MSNMLIAACVAWTVVSGFYILWPLFKESRGNLEVELLAETELDRLLTRKSVIYTNLRDLEFEFKLGRLGDDDFERLQAGYKSDAALVLKRLDALGAQDNLDEKIEQTIQTRRSKLFGSSKKKAASGEGATCPACDSPVIPGKKFCADCGQQLQT